MTAPVRTLGGALSSPLERGWNRWNRSMAVRVLSSTLVLGLAVVALLGTYVTTEIRDGLVSRRIDRILEESARDTFAAQARFDASTATTPNDLQVLLRAEAQGLQAQGDGERGVLLLRAPDEPSGLLLSEVVSSADLVEIVSNEMREDIRGGSRQSWQFVALGDSAEPGVVVGTEVEVPEAGTFELYLVYNLSEQRDTLNLIQQVLGLGAAGLVALVLFMTWSVTQQVVRPVRHAARVATRLTEGMLDERMEVRGRDEMATLATTFNEMAESLQRQIVRLESMSRVQRRFVSDVSHELRTPLTTVRMASDVLHDARGSFEPSAARSAELLTTQLDRFELLLADLLEISRIDAGAAQLEFEDSDLAAIVRDVIESMTPAATGLGVTFRLFVGKNEHTASMDRPRVSRIVRNLAANAIEHAQGKAVDIAVDSNRRGVAVVVRDYGIGMTPQQVDHVFDRFWRADPGRARTMGGTGLGLSIAHEDAQLHGGALEAWGSPGKGASFRLTLPRTSRGLGKDPVLPLAMKVADFTKLGPRIALTHMDEEHTS